MKRGEYEKREINRASGGERERDREREKKSECTCIGKLVQIHSAKISDIKQHFVSFGFNKRLCGFNLFMDGGCITLCYVDFIRQPTNVR